MFTFLFAKLNLLFFAAAGAGSSCSVSKPTFFFLQPWWNYLGGQVDELGNCAPHVNFPNDLWLIGMAVLDDLLRLAGFLAVISVMIAGAQLVFTEGNPEKATSARNRLINSLIGLAIAFSAAAIVGFAGSSLGGSAQHSLPGANANQSYIQNLLNIVFVIIGAFAFLFTVIAGLRYVLAGGNSDKTAEARRQIIHAALGLLIIAMAAVLVNFVIGRLSS